MLRRLQDGQYAEVSGTLNSWADEIDALNAGCQVRRLDTFDMPANTEFLVSWMGLDYDTGGGMWSPGEPFAVRVQLPGTYELAVQVRYPYATTGAPYNTGTRAARIMKGGTNPAVHTVVSRRKAWSVDGEGVTVTATAQNVACPDVGTPLYVSVSHTASGTLAGQLDGYYGGTYLSVTRTGPIP